MAGEHRRGQAHVVGESGCALLFDRRLAGLQVEAAQHGLARARVGHPVGLADDAIALVGAHVGQDVGLMDGFQQAQPDHGRRQAGRDLRVGAHRAVAQVLDAVGGLHQRGGLAAVERHDHRRVIDLHAPFGRQAGHGEVLQLHAIDRLGQRGDLVRPQPPDGHGPALREWPGAAAAPRRRAVPADRNPAPSRARPGVTGLAGARVEQRPQAIGGLGGRRRHPVLAKQAIADLELLAALEIHVGRGCEKMSALIILPVVAAPGMVSKVSALEKSRAGAVMAVTRFRSRA